MLHIDIIILYIDIQKSHVNINNLHVDIIILHIDIIKSHVNVSKLHEDIIYLTCSGQKYANIQKSS